MIQIASLVAAKVTGLVGLLCLLTAAEFVLPTRARHSAMSRLPGFLYWVVSAASAVTLFTLLSSLWKATGVGSLVTVNLTAWLEWAGPVGIVAACLAATLFGEFCAYWYHRAQHAFFIWRIHAVHHSIEELNVVNSYGHAADEIFRFVFVAAPMSLIAIVSPTLPLLFTVLIFISPFYNHSPIKLHFGPLRWILVDNRFHRIHHSIEPRHFGKNYGFVTPIFDIIFGTAYFPAPDEWPDTGLADVRQPRSLGEWLSFPFRSAPSGVLAGRRALEPRT